MHRAPIHSVSPPAHPLHPLAPGREIRPNSLKNSRKNAQNRPAARRPRSNLHRKINNLQSRQGPKGPTPPSPP